MDRCGEDLYVAQITDDMDVPIIRKHFQRQVPSTTSREDGLYPSLKIILSECLRFNPNDRPTFAQILDEIKLLRPEDEGVPPDQIAAGLDKDWSRSFAVNTQFNPRQVDGTGNRIADRTPSPQELIASDGLA
jgi:hypothetical protein